jgi:hypothetical protein
VQWTEPRRVGVLLIVAILFTVLATLLILRKARPNVVVRAASHAVVFVPSRDLDLVAAATPRHGLEPGGTPFTGLRFTPMLPNDSAMRAFTGAWPAPDRVDSVHSIQRLAVTSGCVVRLESYVAGMVRLDVEHPPLSDGSCRMIAELTLIEKGIWSTIEVPREIEVGAPATLIFASPYPVHFRNFPVSEIRFETSDTGLVRSAILDAQIELPDVGNVGAKASAAHVGDAVTLGELEGTIAELVVRDTLRTLFKGKASKPSIDRRDLRPPVLEHLTHTHWRLGIAFVMGAVGIVAAFLPKAR